MRSNPTTVRFLGMIVCLLACVPGCRTTLEPNAEDSRIFLDPVRDPGIGPFTLESWIAGPLEQPVRLALLGHDLRVEGHERIALEVSIANRSDRSLFPDLIVWLSDFQPADVVPVNPDLVPPAPGGSVPSDPIWGFDYSELLGEDGVLSPGEVSGVKTWRFDTPELQPFSFGASAEFQLEPHEEAHLSGIVFIDQNENGRLDPFEPPFPGGALVARGPGGGERETSVDPHGRYRFQVELPGLYSVRYFESSFGTLLPVSLTTPNPLQVILIEGPDGVVGSYGSAHFGLRPFGPPVQPILLTDAPPDSILQDPYDLLELDRTGHILHTGIAFSGCSPDHPLQLYMSQTFMESNPVRARIVLMHDGLGEPCDAYFTVRRDWDLTPLVEAYRMLYGGPDGKVILVLVTPNGEVHELLFEF